MDTQQGSTLLDVLSGKESVKAELSIGMESIAVLGVTILVVGTILILLKQKFS